MFLCIVCNLNVGPPDLKCVVGLRKELCGDGLAPSVRIQLSHRAADLSKMEAYVFHFSKQKKYITTRQLMMF